MIASGEPGKGWISAFWISVCLLRTPPCEAVSVSFHYFFFFFGEKTIRHSDHLDVFNLSLPCLE